ncbi:MAG: hypothetical protein IJY07_04175 [Clostridia bacterium]|nr:hypothetical protein [Clostridia bacterium]
MLIKKTVVLLDEIKTVGHISIIRLGQETGVKMSLAKAMSGKLLIKLSGSKQECFDITATRMEFLLESTLLSSDLIGVLIVDDKGEIQAKGGRADIVNPYLLGQKEEIKTEEVSLVEEQPAENEEKAENEQDEQPKIEIMEPKAMESEQVEQTSEQQGTYEETPKNTTTTPSPFNFIKGDNFYKNVRGKLNEIMTANPVEERLQAIIPDSKWVKVYYDKDEYYVVGILTDEGEVKFLAYGVPGVKSVKPPKDAEELCDFVEVKGGLGEGYWIMFQDAKNGEIVKSI